MDHIYVDKISHCQSGVELTTDCQLCILFKHCNSLAVVFDHKFAAVLPLVLFSQVWAVAIPYQI